MLRVVVESAVENGRRLLQRLSCPRCTKPVLRNKRSKPEVRLESGPAASDSTRVAAVGAVGTGFGGFAFSERVVGYLRPVTSRLFDGLVRKVAAPLWSEAKRHATKRLVFGETAPFFALVGVTLGSGSQQGLITKQDELEALCADIRNAVMQVGWLFDSDDGDNCHQQVQHHDDHQDEFDDTEEKEGEMLKHKFSLCDLTLGTVIDKGCNAVVYAARWNAVEKERNICSFDEGRKNPRVNDEISSPPSKKQRATNMQKVEEESRRATNVQKEEEESRPLDVVKAFELQNEKKSFDHDFSSNSGEVMVSESDNGDASHSYYAATCSTFQNESDQTLNDSCKHTYLSKSTTTCASKSNITDEVNHLLCSGTFSLRKNSRQLSCAVKKDEKQSIVKDKPPDVHKQLQRVDHLDKEIRRYPLAVKMMFNYDVQSNAPAILKAMYRELIPAKHVQLDEHHSNWQGMFTTEKISLPHHPNVVKMPCVFVDSIPMLEDGLSLFPDALPARLNPYGFGRNKSLFCVMKRYHMSLHDYLMNYSPPVRTSLMLLTQLLEGILHINSNSIAHRDLKSDNILISLEEGWQYPFLVVSDFGCCMADPSLNMTVPFVSFEADPRQGNAALMAPEVKTAVPGILRSISYQLADVWTVGALAYEIFGLRSPFFTQSGQKGTKGRILDSATYKESQLPQLPREVPTAIKHLVRDLLHRSPRNRPTAEVAATLCQLVLWAPSKWLNRHSFSLPSHTEVMQWLLCLTTKVLCESRAYQGEGGQPERQGGQLEYKMVSTFLARVQYRHIIQAIKWNRAF